jgi:hypothetical protein
LDKRTLSAYEKRFSSAFHQTCVFGPPSCNLLPELTRRPPVADAQLPIRMNIPLRSPLIAVTAFFSAVVCAENLPRQQAGGDAGAPSSVVFQNEIAPVIAESRSTYPQAKRRYNTGLPAKNIFYVAFRVVDGFGRCGLVWVRVSRINDAKSEVSGWISAEVHALAPYSKGDPFSGLEADIIDWRISHPDGTEEGNVVGRFLASRVPNADVPALLRDQREIDMSAFLLSPAVDDAVGQVFLRLFDDSDLKPEQVKSPLPTIEEWPALARKYRDKPSKQLFAELKTRATAIKATEKVIVENGGFLEKPLITLTAYVVLRKRDVVYEVRQFLHFNYDHKDRLEKVTWGLRSIKTVHVKPAVNLPGGG